MLALSDAFIKAASSASASPAFLVDLQVTDTENHKIISAPASGLNYPISVAEVSQVSGSLDILKRTMKINECSITVIDDDLIRSIFEAASREPKGRFIDVYIGFDGLQESDFAPYFRGILEELRPQPGQIELVCKNHAAVSIDAEAPGIGWHNKHPLQAIVELLQLAGVPDDKIAFPEFDPDSVVNGRYKNLVSSPGIEADINFSTLALAKTKGPLKGSYLSIISELSSMMHGACYTDEYGVVRFTAFDKDRSPSKHLTVDDYRNFQQQKTYDHLCNHLKIIQKEGDDLENNVQFHCHDSQADFAPPNESEFVRTVVQRFAYTGLKDYTETTIIDGSAILGSQSIDPSSPSRRGYEAISGLKLSPSDGAHDMTGVTSDDPIYLYVDGSIVECTGAQAYTASHRQKRVFDFNLDGSFKGHAYLPTNISVTGCTSGKFGTQPLDLDDYSLGGVGFARLDFIDCTAAVLWAEDYFKRFGHGCPTIKIETSLEHYDLQIGEFITLDEPGTFYFKHESGLNHLTVWEIVGKETHVTPSGTYISLSLAFVRRSSLTPLSIGSVGASIVKGQDLDGVGIIAQGDVVNKLHVIEGLDVLIKPGLEVEINIGKAFMGKWKGSNATPQSYPVEANKDNYIYFDPVSGGILSEVVDIGSPKPDDLGVLLSKVTTNGSGVDSVEDLREFASITGGKLLPGEGPLANLDAAGGFTGQIDIGQILNAPDFTGISASVAGLDQRVGTIEGDYATSGDIPDVSNFITNADLPDHSQFATTTALAAVSTVANGAIQSGQEQITAKDFHEKTSGLDDGLIPNPSFYQFDQNDYPTHWYTWNTNNEADPNDNSVINIVDGNSTRGRYSVHINGSRFPDGSSPHTPVLISKGCNVGYSDHLRIEVHCGATTPDTLNASWAVTVYYYYCLPDGSIYYTGANTGMNHTSDQFISGAATLGSGFQPRLLSLKIKPQGDQWWIDKATAAAAGNYPDALNYVGYPIEARFSFRQTNIVNDKYGFKVCYFNAHRVGNNVKDWDDSTIQYVADINTTAANAQNTADAAVVDAGMASNAAALASVAAANAQNTADAAAASHYALAELELRPADVPSGGWNDEIIVVCPTMLAGGGSGLIVYD